ncbi:MAG: DUF5305 family protein [Eubacteriales bacterium]|nr:DUF5305 family protein [Eubacteriales bacterium]MDD3199873.1 DUF5305 family protein [Eubacteriales bacterium]MDD4630265.1 DUF5305 family protein [Eubacteriales bacterium]
MKLVVHKKSKKALLLILSLLIILSCIQLSLVLLQPKTTTAETTVYESNCELQSAYKVIIFPNEVYADTTQKEGGVYSKKLLSYIQAEFGVEYAGSMEVPLDIEYQIISTVNGYQGNDREKKIYWSKVFPLTAQNKVKEKSGIWSKNEKVNFPLAQYDAFAIRAKEITGMDVSNEVIVSMKGKVIAHTEKEDLETPFDVSIKVPLMEDVFEISKPGLNPIKNSITVTEEIPAPLDIVRVITYSILLAFSIIGIAGLLLYTREPDEQELLKKKINSILKNHGSRIIALQSIPKANYKQHYKVHSIKDLIKIADEIQKPIYYEIDKDTVVKNYEFYVIENETIYTLCTDETDLLTSTAPKTP